MVMIEDARVVVPAPKDEAIRHLSWPKIVRAGDGTLIVGYSAGIGHNEGASGLAISRSTDGGQTFSDPQLLCYYPDDDPRYRDVGNLALGIGEGGAIVLLAMAFGGDEANTILGWRSLDHGAAWARTDTAAIGENRTGSVFGHVFALPGRALGVCGHYRKPEGDGLWIARSADNGASWGPPQPFTRHRYHEPCFVHADGKLIGLVRESDAHAYHQFLSPDLGETWQFTERAIQGDAEAIHPSPFLTVDPTDPEQLLALVSERAPAQRITLWKAHRDELCWRRVGLIVEDDATWDWTYPWMTHLGGDAWFLVYYQRHGDGAAIHGGWLTIPRDRNSPG